MRLLAIIFGTLVASGCTSSGPSPTRTTPASRPEPARPETPALSASGAIHSVMSPAVTSFGAATDGSHVYVLGGYRGTPHQYSREGQSRTLSRVALGGGAFEEIATLPHGLQGVALVHVRGRVCAIGGNRVDNAEGEPTVMISTRDVVCFEPSSREWSRLPPLPEGRSSHEAAVIGSTIYVAGGWRLTGDATTGRFHATLMALDVSADEPAWRSIPAPFERRAVGVTALDGKLLVVGGITPDGEISRRVDVYDPATGAFSRGPDFPVDAFGVSVTSSGGAAFGSAADGGVHRLRLGDPEWTKVGALAFPRFFHQLVEGADGALLALGGISGMHTFGRTRIVEEVSLTPSGERVGAVVVEAIGEAKNRQGVFLIDDFLYFFGGNKSLGQHDFEPHHFTDEGVRLHVPSLRFDRVGRYPEKRQTMSTLVLGARGLALGGFGHDGTAAVSHLEGYVYDFEAGSFEQGPSLESGRTQFGLAEHEGAIYVFGGLNYDPGRGEGAFDHVTTVLRASSLEGGFEELGVRMPGPRRAFAGAVLGGRYYLVGGMKEDFQLVDDCLAFDFASQRFESISCPATARLSGELLALDGRLFLVGGSVLDGEGMRDSRAIEAYDPETDAWSTVVAALPFETRHTRAFVYGERLLLVSTHFEEPRLRLAVVDVARRPAGN
jgi:hypothetical protein